MKVCSNQYKENIKNLGRELDSKVTYTIDGELIELGVEELNSVTPHFESDLFKSVMKQLDIDSNIEIPKGTELNYQFGVKVNGEYEYINYGNYIVYSVEEQKDTKSYKIICYDKMLYSMVDYADLGIQYPITVREYISAICNHLGLIFKNASGEFANYDKVIENELFLSEDGTSLNYTFRDVLTQLAEVTASIICINENDDELEIRYLNDTENEITDEDLKDVNVDFGEVIGPINSVVLSRSAESDNIYLRDEESVTENGLTEVKIIDNQIMNFNDRSDYLPDILEKVNGIEYSLNDFASTGITYHEVFDKYNVTIEDKTYPCIMFNDEALITKGLEENVFTELTEKNETDYKKSDTTDRRINQAYLIVNKQNQTIEGVVERQEEMTTDLEENYYNKSTTDQLILDTASGLINRYTVGGGNNIFRNTGLYFESNDWDSGFEFWNGVVVRQNNNNSQSQTSMYLQNGILEQRQEVANDIYCISFKYNRLNDLAEATVTINNNTYDLDASGTFTKVIEVQANLIDINFNCNVDNGYEVYELMVNFGEVPLNYSQNQNETKTDTVEISEGIKITSTTTDSTLKANADGIRVEDKSGNITTEFLDSGTKTNNIEAKRGLIANLLIEEVDGQIWITGIR